LDAARLRDLRGRLGALRRLPRPLDREPRRGEPPDALGAARHLRGRLRPGVARAAARGRRGRPQRGPNQRLSLLVSATRTRSPSPSPAGFLSEKSTTSKSAVVTRRPSLLSTPISTHSRSRPGSRPRAVWEKATSATEPHGLSTSGGGEPASGRASTIPSSVGTR